MGTVLGEGSLVTPVLSFQLLCSCVVISEGDRRAAIPNGGLGVEDPGYQGQPHPPARPDHLTLPTRVCLGSRIRITTQTVRILSDLG